MTVILIKESKSNVWLFVYEYISKRSSKLNSLFFINSSFYSWSNKREVNPNFVGNKSPILFKVDMVNKVKQILFPNSLFKMSSEANLVIWFEKKYV